MKVIQMKEILSIYEILNINPNISTIRTSLNTGILSKSVNTGSLSKSVNTEVISIVNNTSRQKKDFSQIFTK